MTCYFPIALKRSKERYGQLVVPCGRCIGCRLDYAGMWAMRCVKEAESHTDNCFITLTYNDEHLPHGTLRPTLVPDDLQRFWKRLRKEYGNGIRYYACGEYGERRHRPHYHAIVFGLDFQDKIHTDTNPKTGDKYYSSSSLNTIWGNGDCIIGDVSYESSSYVARYCIDKKTGNKALFYDEQGIEPEFCRMSRRPGIGADWLMKFRKDVSAHDYVVHDGRKRGLPRYYSKLLEVVDPIRLDELKAQRKEKSEKAYWRQKDLGAAPLKIREKFKRSQVMRFLRELGD